jgi:hypothetical protein
MSFGGKFLVEGQPLLIKKSLIALRGKATTEDTAEYFSFF